MKGSLDGSKSEMMRRLFFEIQEQIAESIVIGRVSIPEVSEDIANLLRLAKEVKTRQGLQEEKMQQDELKLQQIMHKKKSFLKQLDQLYLQEAEIIKQKNHLRTQPKSKRCQTQIRNQKAFNANDSSDEYWSSSSLQKNRSYFSPEQKRQIKKILESKKRDSKKYQKLTSAILVREMQERKKNQEQQKLRLQRIKQQRRQALIEKHKQKQRRKKVMDSQNETQTKSKSPSGSKEYLHIKFERQFLERQKGELKLEQAVISQKHQRMHLSLAEINIHQKNYESWKESKLEEEKNRLLEYISQQRLENQKIQMKRSRSMISGELSIVGKMEQDELKAKQLKQQQELKAKVYRERIKSYEKAVQQKHRPSCTKKSVFEMQPPRKSHSVSINGMTSQLKYRTTTGTLSSKEIQNIGNSNMEFCKQKLKLRSISENKNQKNSYQSGLNGQHSFQSQPTKKLKFKSKALKLNSFTDNTLNLETNYDSGASEGAQNPNSLKYRNYLKDVRQMNQKQKASEEEKLNRILKQQNLSMMELKKALNIANRVHRTQSSANSYHQSRFSTEYSEWSRGPIKKVNRKLNTQHQ